MPVENPLPKPTSSRRPRRRIGRCYELAGQYSIDDPSWTLVHGTARGTGDVRVGHAWLKRGDTVYCPVVDQSFECWDYTLRYQAAEVATYSKTEAVRAMVAASHWGPWHDFAGKA